MDMSAHQAILLYAFAGAFLLGAVAHKTNFCTMGAVSDWVNMGNKARLWSWFVAIAVAMLGTTLLQAQGFVDIGATIPPYRTTAFAWLRYIVGGVLFGIGMTLAGGCGSKTLINIGGGNLKSLLVMFVAGGFAFLMTKTAFYETLFHGWVTATTVDLSAYGMRSQALPDVLAAVFGGAEAPSWIAGVLIALIVLALAFRNSQFRKHRNHWIGGVSVGLIIAAGWYVTGGPLGREALEAIEWLDEKPLGVGVQSYTFINPMGETLYYLSTPRDANLITFGVMALAGMVLGAALSALLSGRFSLTWFTTLSDFIKHMVGGVLIGVGGVLAMGCSIGQGITGMSTLALGSCLALGGIIFGAALTMKVQYYLMVYEDDANFAGAFLSSLVDMHLLPAGLRRLDPP